MAEPLIWSAVQRNVRYARDAVRRATPIAIRESLVILLPLIIFKRVLPRFEPLIILKLPIPLEDYRLGFTLAQFTHILSLRSLLFVSRFARESQQVPVRRFCFRVWLISVLTCAVYVWSFLGNGSHARFLEMESISYALTALHSPIYMAYYVDRFFNPVPLPIELIKFPGCLRGIQRPVLCKLRL